MNEWKELEIDNLPSDILTGDYEWEYDSLDIGWILLENAKSIEVLVDRLKHSLDKYRYRKPEPKAPSHEEILQRVKKELNIHIDTKVSHMKKDIILHMNKLYDCLESDTPPEAKK